MGYNTQGLKKCRYLLKVLDDWICFKESPNEVRDVRLKIQMLFKDETKHLLYSLRPEGLLGLTEKYKCVSSAY